MIGNDDTQEHIEHGKPQARLWIALGAAAGVAAAAFMAARVRSCADPRREAARLLGRCDAAVGELRRRIARA